MVWLKFKKLKLSSENFKLLEKTHFFFNFSIDVKHFAHILWETSIKTTRFFKMIIYFMRYAAEAGDSVYFIEISAICGLEPNATH